MLSCAVFIDFFCFCSNLMMDLVSDDAGSSCVSAPRDTAAASKWVGVRRVEHLIIDSAAAWSVATATAHSLSGERRKAGGG